jgi:hypothetical protein
MQINAHGLDSKKFLSINFAANVSESHRKLNFFINIPNLNLQYRSPEHKKI